MSDQIFYRGDPYCMVINCDILNFIVEDDEVYIHIFDHDLNIKRTLNTNLVYYTFKKLIKDLKNVCRYS